MISILWNLYQIQMFSQPTFPKKMSNRYFQLRFAQEKFSDLQCKLYERLQCIQLQLINIELLSSNSSQKYSYLLSQTKHQYENLSKYISQIKKQSTKKLLIGQTNIEQQSQKYNILKQYEERLQQMNYNLYSKQVDISVDHIGKLQKQKPYNGRVKELTRINTQCQNIEKYVQKIEQFKKSLHRTIKFSILVPNQPNQTDLNKKDKQMMYKNKTQTKIRLSQIQQQKKQSVLTKQSSNSSDSNPQVQDMRLKVRRKLLISSQKQMYEDKDHYSDPQLTKMFNLIKKQLKKQFQLKHQYKNLKNRFGDLCMENRDLTKQYYKALENNKTKLIVPCILDNKEEGN